LAYVKAKKENTLENLEIFRKQRECDLKCFNYMKKSEFFWKKKSKKTKKKRIIT
jgi:hypothetical protein